ncbi:MAG: hypothetical protein J6T55_01770 [Alphaproteobacteria bacterium]|nr:hypothetical protein [Alphaproteobacteria bacterium]
MRFFNFFKKENKSVGVLQKSILKIDEKAHYIEKETERERLYRERYSNPENSTIYGSKELRDWEEKKRFIAHKRWYNLQRQR